MSTLERLNEVRSEGVIGIGLGGTERPFPPEPFESLYEEARRMGFRTTAHAGEAAGPQSVWGAISRLHVDRIGHGTSAHEDPELLDYLAIHGIPLELCPTSNVRTGAVSAVKAHPIRHYFEHGLIVSVNTDDPKMFGNSLAEEFGLLEGKLGFSRDEIRSLILQGIQAAWLSEDRKQQLVEAFRSDPAWQGGTL